MKHEIKFSTKVCTVCGQSSDEGRVTTDCTGGVVKLELLKLVQEGKLDYRNGEWTNIKPVSQHNDLFIVFMNAMDEELSPEASDKLTDEDVNLLKGINSVPLPVGCVSKLELPVEQLVSLHKLKRLGYVYLCKEAKQYRIDYKNNKFLKPKPVTLTMSQLHALASIGDEPMLLGDVSGYGIWAEVEYLKKLDMVHQKSGKAVISTKGYDHLQKLLAVLV